MLLYNIKVFPQIEVPVKHRVGRTFYVDPFIDLSPTLLKEDVIRNQNIYFSAHGLLKCTSIINNHKFLTGQKSQDHKQNKKQVELDGTEH